MIGELYINDKDAFLEWGITMDGTSLSTLMTPAPNKPFVSNKSRLDHGKSVLIDNPRIDERVMSLALNFLAKNEAEFHSNYDSFCKELETGVMNISTKYRPNEVYRTIYISCTAFRQFRRQRARFTLRLEEPNPHNRSL